MSANVWDDPSVGAEHRRRMLARATAGQSEESSKASMLAEMYRPPVELISRLSWDDARDRGKATEKWLLVNVQDPSIFDCQVLNRDIWKDSQIRETVRENFIFMQYNRDDPRGMPYVQFYFRDSGSPDAYPHIAIVDPRTGEQVKVWSGPPVPKPMEFLMQLHEFLDRYSLKPGAKNPIPARRAAAGIDLERMTEEQMLEMAMQNSLASQAPPPPSQPLPQAAASEPRQGASPSPEPDEHLRRSAIRKGKMVDRGGDATAAETTADGAKAQAEARFSEPNGNVQRASAAAPPTTAATAPASASPFAAISSAHPHEEPPADPATTTRIQFRHAGGRIIRRFLLTDPVRRLYEWLKAAPIDGKAGMEFELVSAGQNLLEKLDASIQDAGLRNQTVMIEFYEDA
jgi:pyruvate/2-oxoglutarate dehydrogenase complex dihydrolipoamide acyltransferase (E2) component